MKTKFIVMAAMAAMFSMGFTACSNNDDEMGSIAQTRGDAINLVAYGDNSHSTRGDATNAGQLQFTDFQTWAYDATTDGLYMGNSATVGRTVTYAAGVWGYTPQQFWPVNELNFVSIAPAASAEVQSNSTASTTGVVTLTTDVVIDADVEDQDDIMFACAKDNSATPVNGPIAKDDYAGDVPLVFKHALSQIVFKGQLPTSGAITKVVIDEIALGGVGSTGTLTFTSAGAFFGGVNEYVSTTVPAVYSLAGTDLEAATWGVNLTNDGIANATAGTAFDLTVSNSANDKHNAWFLLPQRTAAWKYYAGATEEDATAAEKLQLKAGGMVAAPASGAYLKVAADLYKDGVKILDKADAIYIPLAISWDRSKKYTYTIEFNGLSALTPITFSVTAEDWTNGGNTDLQM
jgi:hypothetical protein